jgi:putative Mg2+ transporter-C (MgtC) family protein
MAWHHFVAYLVTALFSGSDHRRRTAVAPRNCRTAHKCASVGGAAMFVSINHLVLLNATYLQVAAPVVSGIGFLRAGVIMREGLSIPRPQHGGHPWCSTAVGSLCGLGFVKEAVIGAAGVLGANVLFRLLARKIDRHPSRLLTWKLVTCFGWFAVAMTKAKCVFCSCTSCMLCRLPYTRCTVKT